jgi:hypothetical protein
MKNNEFDTLRARLAQNAKKSADVTIQKEVWMHFAGASNFITTRAALERLGWDFDGYGITLDHIRIDEREGSLSWSPCDYTGDNSQSGTQSILSRDVAACLNDMATLAASGELQPL